jgi:predicted DNA binding CopG/RHH family protein
MKTVQSWEEVPRFASDAEEGAFWSTHELSNELLEEMRPDADPRLRAARTRTRPIAIRFDESTVKRIKELAQRRGKGYQTLLKEFVSERLYEEEKREGILGG